MQINIFQAFVLVLLITTCNFRKTQIQIQRLKYSFCYTVNQSSGLWGYSSSVLAGVQMLISPQTCSGVQMIFIWARAQGSLGRNLLKVSWFYPAWRLLCCTGNASSPPTYSAECYRFRGRECVFLKPSSASLLCSAIHQTVILIFLLLWLVVAQANSLRRQSGCC